ncbi:hypothetical protein BESB_054440 [Besnoitia besnoiti]|uniref:CCR4-Not complex component Not N-terminal domain-containing protein n=1 Tax=Besnoitia besnoiti TaxID=94643 RepID=A0A2A9MJG4_BESBE|nr:hypothetical protein BESB_054440 [Besnoitia besnoiti]PFH35793.1 hypothetical protein BESB_054440 [Besnoitia besnoiti]
MALKKLHTEVDKAIREVRACLEAYDERWQELLDFNRQFVERKDHLVDEAKKEVVRGKKHSVRTSTLELLDYKHVNDAKTRIEADLEGALRKLHRLKQQLADWVHNYSDRDIRNKDTLTELRKSIELRYKRGRVFYSQGRSSQPSSLAGGVGRGACAPLEAPSAQWIVGLLDSLGVQVEAWEGELAALRREEDEAAGGSRDAGALLGRKPRKKGGAREAREGSEASGLAPESVKQERVEQLTAMLDLHRSHVRHLEQLLHAVCGEEVDEEDERLGELRDILEPYVHDNADLAIIVAEDVYQELGLVSGDKVRSPPDDDAVATAAGSRPPSPDSSRAGGEPRPATAVEAGATRERTGDDLGSGGERESRGAGAGEELRSRAGTLRHPSPSSAPPLTGQLPRASFSAAAASAVKLPSSSSSSSLASRADLSERPRGAAERQNKRPLGERLAAAVVTASAASPSPAAPRPAEPQAKAAAAARPRPRGYAEALIFSMQGSSAARTAPDAADFPALSANAFAVPAPEKERRRGGAKKNAAAPPADEAQARAEESAGAGVGARGERDARDSSKAARLEEPLREAAGAGRAAAEGEGRVPWWDAAAATRDDHETVRSPLPSSADGTGGGEDTHRRTEGLEDREHVGVAARLDADLVVVSAESASGWLYGYRLSSAQPGERPQFGWFPPDVPHVFARAPAASGGPSSSRSPSLSPETGHPASHPSFFWPAVESRPAGDEGPLRARGSAFASPLKVEAPASRSLGHASHPDVAFASSASAPSSCFFGPSACPPFLPAAHAEQPRPRDAHSRPRLPLGSGAGSFPAAAQGSLPAAESREPVSAASLFSAAFGASCAPPPSAGCAAPLKVEGPLANAGRLKGRVERPSRESPWLSLDPGAAGLFRPPGCLANACLEAPGASAHAVQRDAFLLDAGASARHAAAGDGAAGDGAAGSHCTFFAFSQASSLPAGGALPSTSLANFASSSSPVASSSTHSGGAGSGAGCLGSPLSSKSSPCGVTTPQHAGGGASGDGMSGLGGASQAAFAASSAPQHERRAAAAKGREATEGCEPTCPFSPFSSAASSSVLPVSALKAPPLGESPLLGKAEGLSVCASGHVEAQASRSAGVSTTFSDSARSSGLVARATGDCEGEKAAHGANASVAGEEGDSLLSKSLLDGLECLASPRSAAEDSALRADLDDVRLPGRRCVCSDGDPSCFAFPLGAPAFSSASPFPLAAWPDSRGCGGRGVRGDEEARRRASGELYVSRSPEPLSPQRACSPPASSLSFPLSGAPLKRDPPAAGDCRGAPPEAPWAAAEPAAARHDAGVCVKCLYSVCTVVHVIPEEVEVRELSWSWHGELVVPRRRRGDAKREEAASEASRAAAHAEGDRGVLATAAESRAEGGAAQDDRRAEERGERMHQSRESATAGNREGDREKMRHATGAEARQDARRNARDAASAAARSPSASCASERERDKQGGGTLSKASRAASCSSRDLGNREASADSAGAAAGEEWARGAAAFGDRLEARVRDLATDAAAASSPASLASLAVCEACLARRPQTLLTFEKGEKVEVLVHHRQGWIFGRIRDQPHRRGWFPDYMLQRPEDVCTPLSHEQLLFACNLPHLVSLSACGPCTDVSPGGGSRRGGGKVAAKRRGRAAWAKLPLAFRVVSGRRAASSWPAEAVAPEAPRSGTGAGKRPEEEGRRRFRAGQKEV